MTDLMIEIDNLAETVAEGWQRVAHDRDAFPRIASEALKKAAPHRFMTAYSVAEWTLETKQLPQQYDLPAAFAAPPVTLYANDHFRIEVNHWLAGTTIIHQHAFMGAFSFVAGTGFEAAYLFDCETKLSPRCQLGRLAITDLRLLSPGDVRSILPGNKLIHAVFHLNRPTVTIVVRADAPLVGPQFVYAPPGIAWLPNIEPHLCPAQLRRRQILSFLAESGCADFTRYVTDVVSAADPAEATDLVLHISSQFRGRADELNKVVRMAAGGYRGLADALVRAIRHRATTSRLLSYLNAAETAPSRFLASALLFLRDRNALLDLASQCLTETDDAELERTLQEIVQLTALRL